MGQDRQAIKRKERLKQHQSWKDRIKQVQTGLDKIGQDWTGLTRKDGQAFFSGICLCNFPS